MRLVNSVFFRFAEMQYLRRGCCVSHKIMIVSRDLQVTYPHKVHTRCAQIVFMQHIMQFYVFAQADAVVNVIVSQKSDLRLASRVSAAIVRAGGPEIGKVSSIIIICISSSYVMSYVRFTSAAHPHTEPAKTRSINLLFIREFLFL
jgi:hypothetical protein